MTIIVNNQKDALDCVMALIAASRAYSIHRAENGDFEITTRD